MTLKLSLIVSTLIFSLIALAAPAYAISDKANAKAAEQIRAHAQNVRNTTSQSTVATPSVTVAQNQNTQITRLKTKANLEIERRITALNKLKAKVQTIKKLSATEKTALTADIQTTIDSLNTLKTKIDADTDLPTLKQDIKSITESYRIYLLYIPKIHLITGSDVVLTTADKLTAIANKLETEISQAKTQGKDVTGLDAKLADMRTQIANATKLAQEMQTMLLALKPEGYPGNKSVLQEARTKLQEARKDLVTAKQDARYIIQYLKQGASPSAAPTTSSSPTTTITPTPTAAE